ncbi:hypothetical protein JNUCC1_00211 [Lentibacillus sp. JNUCC-1]|nr:hypothetical protein [Lentibacillus sp. JNUCC-1]MUV36409.1 hypothetical protein [Lentibacillus sp. JNUCC-1]
MTAWFYWTLAHFIYSLIVGWLVIHWKNKPSKQKEAPSEEHISL